ncbi:E3 SUMO-protein ligase ZNF451 isoform X1 [Lepisosteus oculatus]|uniref:E3 SUMO-protein ligase ZNF451 isoform X1 n=1 Tax=Lepisosteus oculatus TaxID=7918 RepID=UPI0035F5117C
MMSGTPANEDETTDEVQFVSEGPLRPVLEYIDLLSDDEDGGSSATPVKLLKQEDHVDRQKAKVASTLDRLARHVAVEKREREEKCRAFKEKMDSQQAHGLQELEFIQGSPHNKDAKRCVDQWLKMPGLKPGVLNGRARSFLKSAASPSSQMHPVTCPVLNCNRSFENVPLLMGHLKRFDHSPCDPTVSLKGSPSISYACVACCRRYPTEQEYKNHLQTKIFSSDADGHSSTLTSQPVHCFACPSCYFLFNIRDECLQHMSARNHFVQTLKLSDKADIPAPLPIPLYAKKLLVGLCKEVSFRVRCMACKKVLNSHMEVTAHFKVQCRNASPVAEAAKTVAQVVEVLRVKGQCALCCKIFRDDNEILKHEQLTLHKVEVISTMEKAILQFCNFFEKSKNPQSLEAWSKHIRVPLLKRPPSREMDKKSPDASKAKRQRRRTTSSGGQEPAPVTPAREKAGVTVWLCECSQRFPAETAAEKHIMAANQICYRCSVCEKRTEDSSLMGLHMSRFHGGAHLNNYLFWCRKCKIEMPRKEDIMSHVTDCHHGHTYYYEQEEPEEPPAPPGSSAVSQCHMDQGGGGPAVAGVSGQWLCRMCEDLFDSESSVYKHCSKVKNHSFHKYLCGLCKERFLKTNTLYRHFQDVHKGQVDIRYFCGLCDSMEYGTEEEFLEHYQSYHSKDYVFMDESPKERAAQPAHQDQDQDQGVTQSCPCQVSGEEQKQNAYSECIKALLPKHKENYSCVLCPVRAHTLEELKTHMNEKHNICGDKIRYLVSCKYCTEQFPDTLEYHGHYHSKHCLLQPCVLQAPSAGQERLEEAKEFEEEIKQALALSLEEANQVTEDDKELEEAITRSLQEF